MNPVLLLIVMALAAFRIYRLIAEDVILDRPRTWITERLDSDTFSFFISCPWCAGFWISLAVVTVTAQLVVVPLPGLQVLAVSALVGLIAGNLD